MHPAFYEPAGNGWLRTFFGGLLTTCGTANIGPPCRDGGADFGLHGRHNVIPAQRLADRSRWEGDEYLVEIEGVVEDSVLFGPKLRLIRRITAAAGSRKLTITDVLENFGSMDAPYMILYHVNPGFPLLDADARLLIQSQSVQPYDEHSRAHCADYAVVSAPRRGFQEENYLHTMQPGADGWTRAALINDRLNIGLYLRFEAANLPYLSEWKMFDEVDYVLGLEPATAPVESREVMRKNGALPLLAAHASKTFLLEIGILDGADEIRAF
jgi:hypothetical protein